MQNHEFSSYCSATKTRSGCRQPSFSVYCFCSFAFLISRCRANRSSGKDARANKRETWPIGAFFLFRSGPPGGRVSLFLPIFFSPSLYRNPWNGTGRKFPPPGWRPNMQDMNHCVAACEPNWSSVIESVQYYPRKTRVFIFPVPMDGPAVRWRGSRVSMFLFRFLFLTLPNSNQNYHPEWIRPRGGTEPALVLQFPELDARSKPDEKDERPPRKGPPLSGHGLLVFLSQLRSGSHNQPSFCVFLLFSLIFNTRGLIMQYYKQTKNHQKHQNIYHWDRKGKREESHRERER